MNTCGLDSNKETDTRELVPAVERRHWPRCVVKQFTCLYLYCHAAPALDVTDKCGLTLMQAVVKCAAAVYRSCTARYDGNDASTVSIFVQYFFHFPLSCHYLESISMCIL